VARAVWQVAGLVEAVGALWLPQQDAASGGTASEARVVFQATGPSIEAFLKACCGASEGVRQPELEGWGEGEGEGSTWDESDDGDVSGGAAADSACLRAHLRARRPALTALLERWGLPSEAILAAALAPPAQKTKEGARAEAVAAPVRIVPDAAHAAEAAARFKGGSRMCGVPVMPIKARGRILGIKWVERGSGTLRGIRDSPIACDQVPVDMTARDSEHTKGRDEVES
jgi:hypothetical protein